LLGLSNYLAGRPAEAIPFLEKVQGWYPRANVDASYILGVCYIQAKDYPHARQSFARMFEVPPESPAAYLFTARMLLRQEFYPIAEEYAQRQSILILSFRSRTISGGALSLQSKIPEAISNFEKELRREPRPRRPRITSSPMRTRACQKFDAAERLLQRSIWLDATSTGPYILMGKFWKKRGNLN